MVTKSSCKTYRRQFDPLCQEKPIFLVQWKPIRTRKEHTNASIEFILNILKQYQTE